MLRALHRHLTVLLTSHTSLVAERPPPTHVLHGRSRVSSTTAGRDSTSPEHTLTDSDSSASMSDSWNPNALPFQPGGFDRREQNFGAFENQLPPPPHPPQAPPGPYGPPGAPWNSNFPPPPPPPPQHPPHMFNNPQAYNDYAAHHQAQAYHQWMMHSGYGHHAPPPPNFPPGLDAFAGRPLPHMQQQHQQQHHHQHQHPPHHGPPPFGQPPYGHPAHHGPPPFMHHPPQQMFANRAHHHTMHSQANFPYGARNDDIQAPTPPGKKSKSGLAANGHAKQKDASKPPKTATPASEKKGRYGDEKIMLPAPQPTQEYIDQAAGEPSPTENPGQMLVILDLNGTVLFRPNRNAKTMIERPFLKPFLRYLFENFKVMVWSSARPDNVKSLVSQALDNDLRSKLVAQWARDSFGLSPTNYQQNVQVYKNLKLVWSRSQIQSYHPEYETGGRFGQHNTVLIDDSSTKASAQPHNLLEIPEFSATPEQMQGDILREVAGYLEALRRQSDVSQFINKQPFKEGGAWTFDWPDNVAGGGEMTSKVSASTPSKKKNKKNKQANAAAAASRANTPLSQTPQSQTPLAQTIDTMASVSLTASIEKDW